VRGSGLQRLCGEHSSPHSPLPPGHPAGSTGEVEERIRKEGVPQVWGSDHQARPASAADPRGGQGRTAAGNLLQVFPEGRTPRRWWP
jgi:hypothetical protein